MLLSITVRVMGLWNGNTDSVTGDEKPRGRQRGSTLMFHDGKIGKLNKNLLIKFHMKLIPSKDLASSLRNFK